MFELLNRYLSAGGIVLTAGYKRVKDSKAAAVKNLIDSSDGDSNM